MYAQLNKPKENEKLAACKSVAHKKGSGVMQRIVNPVIVGNQARAIITSADIGTGTPPSVSYANIPTHIHALTGGVTTGAAHPYHHHRGHLIGAQLGGDGADANNLVGLSDGTNVSLMTDIEGLVRDALEAQPGSSVYITVDIDYNAANYVGTAAAPYIPGMVAALTYTVYDAPGGTQLYQVYLPNGAVNNHGSGCC